MLSVICYWGSYEGTRCRRNVERGEKFCAMHLEFLQDYKVLKENEDVLCSMKTPIKIEPRSYKHLMSVMKQLNTSGTTVDVMIKNSVGLVEEADISDDQYICLLSDDSKYYYHDEKARLKAKQLRVLLTKFCDNPAVVRCKDDEQYCETCYKRLDHVPILQSLKMYSNVSNVKVDEKETIEEEIYVEEGYESDVTV